MSFPIWYIYIVHLQIANVKIRIDNPHFIPECISANELVSDDDDDDSNQSVKKKKSNRKKKNNNFKSI